MIDLFVTPLVLLIMFFMAIPASIPLVLPPQQHQLPQDVSLTISLGSDGKVTVDGIHIDANAIVMFLDSLPHVSKDSRIEIRADADVDYAAVSSILKILGSAGYTKIGLASGGQ